MFCENCGKEIPDIARFCPYCSAEVVPTIPADDETIDLDSVTGTQPVQDHEDHDSERIVPDHQGPEEPSDGNRRRRIWIPIVIIVVVAAAVVLFFLLMQFGYLDRLFAPKAVDLDNYVEVEYEGYNGSGTANAVLDYTALGDEYDGKIKVSKEAEEAGYSSFAEVIEDTVTMEVIPDADISNGDDVSVNMYADSEQINNLVRGKVDLLYATKIYTVLGLEEIDTFDAFADVAVTFSGASPNGKASLDVGSGELSADAYTISPADGLSLGETVTVSIDPEAAETYRAETGLYPEKLSKEYRVEGIDGYVSSLDEIPDEDMEAMKDYSETVKTDKADSWPADVHRLDSIEYVGCYFLTEKPGEDRGDDNADDADNILYLVYKLNVTKYGWNEDGSSNDVNFDYYWYGSFTDAEMLADGSFSIDYDTFTEPAFDSDSSFSVTTYDYREEDPEDQELKTGYRGYKDLDSLYENLIAPNLAAYECEYTVTE